MDKRSLFLCVAAACTASHGSEAPGDAETRDATTLDSTTSDGGVGDAGGPCTTPIGAPLVLRDDVETASFFVHEGSHECAFLCSHRECAELDPQWRHVLDFEYLPDARRTRVATRFTGIGQISSTTEGDLIGDGLVRDIRFDVATTVGLRSGSDPRAELVFVLHDEGSARTVTVRRFDD